MTNAVPHFVNGISGDPFPSPFSDPPGKGLSAPWVNVLWGFFNFLVGYLLYRAAKISPKHKLSVAILFLGILVTGLMLAMTFAEKATA